VIVVWRLALSQGTHRDGQYVGGAWD